MAYSLYIEKDCPITIDEWLKVVETVSDLRIDDSDTIGINPATGEKIRISNPVKKNAALWFPKLEEWIKVFFFLKGRILIKPNDWDNSDSPLRDKSFELARKLNAKIVGDNGEIYTESK